MINGEHSLSTGIVAAAREGVVLTNEMVNLNLNWSMGRHYNKALPKVQVFLHS